MTWLFWIFGLATCGGAVGVVLSQNIARMAFWLIVSLGSTAGLFFLLNADFVGATQLMVYVGGTLVLLIFGVMLTASGPYVTMKTSPVEWVAAAIVSSALLSLILVSAYRVPWSEVSPKPNRQAGYTLPQQGQTIRPIGMALLGLRPDKTGGEGYLLPFEIASVHLLVVLVGAAYLARTKRRVTESSEAAKV